MLPVAEDVSLFVNALRGNASCMQEKHFLQMPNPYMGMWIADRVKMKNFTSSLHWTKQKDPWEVCGCTTVLPSLMLPFYIMSHRLISVRIAE